MRSLSARACAALALGASLVLGFVGLGEAFAGAATPPIFVVAPVGSGLPYFAVTAAPGTTFQRVASITNRGKLPLTFLVYPVDASTLATSGVAYSNAGAPALGAATWVKVSGMTVKVPGHHTSAVSFSVTVPAHTPPGDDVTGVAFEQLPTTAQRKSGTAFRGVVGLEISVPGRAAPRIAVSAVKLEPAAHSFAPSLLITLANVGRRLCQPRLLVGLTRHGIPQNFSQQLGTVLPGGHVLDPFGWPEALPAGHYTLEATVRGCGTPTVVHGVATLTKPISSGQRGGGVAQVRFTHPTAAAGRGWLLYAALALAALLLVGLLAVPMSRVRRGPRRGTIARSGALGAPPAGAAAPAVRETTLSAVPAPSIFSAPQPPAARAPLPQMPAGEPNPWAALADTPPPRAAPDRSIARPRRPQHPPAHPSATREALNLPRWKLIVLVVLGSLITQELAAWLERRLRGLD